MLAAATTLASAHALPLECAERVQALLQQGGRRILGIAAAPGAGKSTLADALAAAFPAEVQVVPMDGFHLANAELRRLARAQRKGAPDTFDAAGYVQLLQRLRMQGAGEVVYAPLFYRTLEEAVAGALAILPTTRVVVTEGNYLLMDDGPWAGVRALLDEAWYLDTDDRLRRERLLARHMLFGRSRDQALQWIEQTDEPNARRIAATRGRADWCVPPSAWALRAQS